MTTYELNIDGLVGPTHHYAGLAYGNLASMTHAEKCSNPKLAALEGLRKMRLLHTLGLKQAVLPPHPRPHLEFLHNLGFTGKLDDTLNTAAKAAPPILSAAFSASSMWAANAATVAPSADTQDARVHFTPANLVHHIHRHLEADYTTQLFKAIFADKKHFVHHKALPKTPAFNDEGAANHNRLCLSHATSGLHLFVYGRHALDSTKVTNFPARQTLEASKAIARKHMLAKDNVFFAAQSPKAIDAGVFHNDVISLANESVFLIHEDAFLEQETLFKALKTKADFDLQLITIPSARVSLEEAVQAYLFNAQLVTLPDNKSMALIAPTECETSLSVSEMISTLIQDPTNPISCVHYVPVRQSMQNGGGPACLRLRIPLTSSELDAMHQGVLVTDTLLDALETCINQHYRSQLSFADLASPEFAKEALDATHAIHDLLGLNVMEHSAR